MEPFAKIVSNSSLKTLTILAKISTLDAWLSPECGYNTVLKTASKDGNYLINCLHLKLKSVNCQRISRPLKQLSKASAWCHSREYLLGEFPANYYQSIYGGIYF